VRVCFTDYDREIALVAEHFDEGQGRLLIASVGRIIRLRGTSAAELSLVVADDYRGRGLGTEMVRRLIEVAKAERVDRLTAEVLATNGGMLRIFSELGFEISELEPGDDTLHAELRLTD
jgi:acetyltransferase